MSTTNPHSDRATILVVEDGESEREALVRVLRMEQYEVMSAADPQHAIDFAHQPIDLVISDLRMGKQSGIDLLRYWRERWPAMPFIIMTAYGDVDSAVTAMKLGAADFITKPVNPDSLLTLVRDCLDRRVVQTHHEQAPSTAAGDRVFDRIVGRSPPMCEIIDQTRRAAHTESTVLVLGESGTGKELIAEAIHQNSPRCPGPFILVNMAAIPETLVESELFGHLKGAFTGAAASRVGRFEAAHGGTIFIDEIGDFPLNLQAKLLRVLENRTITPVGGNRDRLVDVRVVAATSRNLAKMTSLGQFREDLYYRLNVVAINLPPLRDRRDDIPLLVEHFVHELARAGNKPPLKISPELMQAFISLDWPGNVRQLRNALESMVVMARGELLTPADLPRNLALEPLDRSAEIAAAAGPMLEDVKRAAMLRALDQFQGNRTRAAEYLGISVRTLQRKLKEWGLLESPGDSQ
jgi:DNA-binding NtrC family response regulator